MVLLYLIGTLWLILLITLAMCFDTRSPMSTKLKYKYRVKDDSIFRKIIKFKDKEHCPCNYFKIVPFYAYLLLAILGLILLFVDIFTGGVITKIVSNKVLAIVILCILSISILYFIVIKIRWGIVDYNEFKFTNEENEELRQFKKLRKKRKKEKY